MPASVTNWHFAIIRWNAAIWIEQMATVFYLVLVFFSRQVDFSFWWFFVSLLFEGGNQVVTQTRIRKVYTNDPSLDGKEVNG